MAKRRLRLAYEFRSRYTDPTDDRIIVDTYDVLEWEFDTLTKLAEQLDTTTYTHDLNGPTAMPQDEIWPTDVEFFDDCQGTTRRGYFHNGNGTFRIEEEANSSACGYQAPPVAGTLLRHECRNAAGQTGQPDSVDRYRISANGAGGEVATLVQANSPTCGYEAPAPVPGCTDPEAQNYDELATEDNGTCTYVPRLDVQGPARLAAVGLPLLFTLASAPTGRTAAPARLLLTVGIGLLAGTVLKVNGESFTAVAANPGPGQFSSGITLATALAGSVTLSARYRITQPAPDQVLLVALAPGSQLTPMATVSDEDGGLVLELTEGVDALRSQTKTEWGCYAEIWAVPGAVWGGAEPDLSEAYFVDRLEQLYQASNAYVFDLAPALLPLVGYSRETSTDRLVAYFVRYGELYQPTGEMLRRRFVVADTPLRWGLESAVPVPPLASVLALSAPMPGWVVPVGQPTYTEQLYVLAPAGAAIELRLATRTVTGVLSTRTRNVVAGGGVHVLALSDVLSQLPAAALRSTCTVFVDEVPVLATTLEHAPAAGALVLLSRRGAYETVWLQGLSDPAPKRQVLTYAAGRSQAVRRVNLTAGRKLATGLLSRTALDWLCDELATSPRVLLLDAGQLTPMVLTGFSPDYNEPENRYSLTCEVEPAAPFAVLTA